MVKLFIINKSDYLKTKLITSILFNLNIDLKIKYNKFHKSLNIKYKNY